MKDSTQIALTIGGGILAAFLVSYVDRKTDVLGGDTADSFIDTIRDKIEPIINIPTPTQQAFEKWQERPSVQAYPLPEGAYWVRAGVSSDMLMRDTMGLTAAERTALFKETRAAITAFHQAKKLDPTLVPTYVMQISSPEALAILWG